MHLTEARLAEADHTADERAHLQSCVRCRLAARRLNTFLGDTPPAIVAPDAQRYIVVRSLGVGGMSQVVLSVDGRLGREVARKKLRTVTSARDVERFVREANITARLEHPNIVPVYDLEVDPEGSPTLTMRVVRGKSLGEAMRTGALPDRRARLEVFLKVCDAIAFAHSRGVVHRDLKPDNVMVGEFGEVQVVDFGLAAQEATEVDATLGGSAALTRSGTVMGTPAYMSPEQARGENDRVGPASDVYGLGATLWEIATGRPPFVGDADAVVAAVALGRVPSPKDVDPSVPRDLAAIVLRAMATDPHDRYPDVSALRRDLVSFLAHAPVSARVPTIADRLAKWFARNRTTVMPVAAVAMLAVLMLIAGLVAWARQATTARDELAHLAEGRRADLASNYVSSGRAAWESGDRLGALPHFAAALALVEGHGHAEEVARIRMAAALQGVPRLVGMFPTEMFGGGVALSGDARFAAVAERKNISGLQVPDTGKVTLWDVASGSEVASAPLGGRGWGVRFSPDGRFIAVVSESPTLPGESGRHTVLWLFDEQLHLLRGPLATAEATGCNRRQVGFTDGGAVAFVRDGCGVAFGAWRVADGAPVTLAAPRGEARVCGASADGSVVLICDRLLDPDVNSMWVQDRRSGRRLGRGIAGRTINFWEQSPAADIIAIAFQGTNVALADPRTGEIASAVFGQHGFVFRNMFSDDGTRVATASSLGAALVTETQTGQSIAPFLWHRSQVHGLGFSHDGVHLATTGFDKLARVWDLDPRGRPAGAPPDATTVAVSPDGRTLLLLRDDRTVTSYAADTGRAVGMATSVDVAWDGPVHLLASDRALVFLANRECAIALLDLAEGRIAARWEGSPTGGCASGTGYGRIVVTTPAGLVEVDVASGDALRPPVPAGGLVRSLDVLPGGSEVIVFYHEATRRWDLATGHTIGPELPPLRTWALDPAGARLAGAPMVGDAPELGSREVVIFDIASGMPVGPPLAHDDIVDGVGWSPDGRQLVTGAEDGTVRVWDADTWTLVMGPLRVAEVSGSAAAVGFSQDGRFVVAQRGGVASDYRLVLFDAVSGEYVTTTDTRLWLPPTIRPDGTGMWNVWGMEPDDRPVPVLADLSAMLAAQRLQPSGWILVPSAEALSLWRAMHDQYPSDLAL